MGRRRQDAPIRTQIVRAALGQVRAAGKDPAALIARFDLPETSETDIEVVVPLATVHAFLDAAETAAGDAFLGLRMALAFPRGLWGLVEFVARSSATVSDGLRRIVEFASLATNRVTVTYTEKDGSGIVEHRIEGEPLGHGRHANEFFICAIVLQGRELCGPAFMPSRAWFAHPAPADASELVRHLGTEDIRFGGGVSGVELPASTLALPLRSADPALLSVLDQQAKKALELQPSQSSFVDQVRGAIRTELDRGAPTIEGVARATGLGVRSLQRRLGDEGLSFRDAIDGVRKELACKMLEDDRMGLGEIAFRLAYGDLSTFVRAFKRWTGATPSEYRGRKMPVV